MNDTTTAKKISNRKLLSTIKCKYPEVYNNCKQSLKIITRPFEDIYLLKRTCETKTFDDRLLFLGAIILMFQDSENEVRFLKDGTLLHTAKAMGIQPPNLTNLFRVAKTYMKYQPELKQQCQDILDGFDKEKHIIKDIIAMEN